MSTKNVTKKNGIIKIFLDQLPLQLMVIPSVFFFFIFSYVPMAGLINSFLDYSLTDGFFGHSWAGLKYFGELFTDPVFFLSVKNTIGMSLIKFVFTFTAPIIFALILNELPFLRLKKLTQTSSYLPHFLSYVVVATLWIIFLDPNGLINNLLVKTHIIGQSIEFLAEPKWFWWIGMVIDCWQETGWNAIIYLAVIVGISPELYEAATIDGASRVRKIISITLPSILPTVSVLFILNIGNLLGGGPVGSNFNQSFLLGNAFNHSTSYVVQYFIIQAGLNQMRFSFASSASLVLSLVSLIMLFSANKISEKITGKGIF
jgi:putative aldouronate transport system permease protein